MKVMRPITNHDSPLLGVLLLEYFLRRPETVERRRHAAVDREHPDVDERARAMIEPRPAPDIAPHGFGDEFLERAVEIRRGLRRGIHILVAQYLAPQLLAFVVALLVHFLLLRRDR